MAGQRGAEKGASAAGGRFLPGLTYSVLALLTVYGFVRSVLAAAGRPFWYDELLTEVVAAQGTWDGIIAALRSPTDGQPPLFYVVQTVGKRNRQDGEFWRSNEAGDAVLVLAFAALPYFAFVFAKLTQSGMTTRYILATVFGILLAFGYFAAQGSRQATVVLATFVLAARISELHFWRFQGTERRAVALRGAETARFFESAGYRELPVVVPNGSTLLATVYYAFPDRAQRFAYLRAERR